MIFWAWGREETWRDPFQSDWTWPIYGGLIVAWCLICLTVLFWFYILLCSSMFYIPLYIHIIIRIVTIIPIIHHRYKMVHFCHIWLSFAAETLVVNRAISAANVRPRALWKKSPWPLHSSQVSEEMQRNHRNGVIREVSRILCFLFFVVSFPLFFFQLQITAEPGGSTDHGSKVWARNFQNEFILFSHTLRFAGAGAVVAIDTEFPGVLQENAWKESDETHYRAMKDWLVVFNIQHT